eukprot:SAG31_NODE_2329_length_5933_cov_5.949263_1_plen_463_part_00
MPVDMTPGADVIVDGDGPAQIVSKSGERVRVKFPDGKTVWRRVGQIKSMDGTPAVSKQGPPSVPKTPPSVPKKKAAGDDPFKIAVEALKSAATRDAAYKKMKDDFKAEDLIEVAVLYAKATASLQSAISCDTVKGTVQNALQGKLDTVTKRVISLKEKASELGIMADLEQAVGAMGTSTPAPASEPEPEPEPEPKPEFGHEHNPEPALVNESANAAEEPRSDANKKPASPAPAPSPAKRTPSIPSKKGKAPNIPSKKVPSIPGKKAPSIPSGAKKKASSGGTPPAVPKNSPSIPKKSTTTEAVDTDEDATSSDATNTPKKIPPPPTVKSKVALRPKPAPVEPPRYEPPPPVEGGKLYAVGDTRQYLEATVFPWLSAALDELSINRPADPAAFLKARGRDLQSDRLQGATASRDQLSLVDALNFDYFDSIATIISGSASHVAKLRDPDAIASFQAQINCMSDV